MTITSSYIFFSNPYAKEKVKHPQEENVIYLNVDSVQLRFEKIFSLDKESNIKQSIFQHTYSFVEDDCNVQILINEVVKSTYAKISVTGKTKHAAVACLEKMELALEASDLENDYVMIVSYDAVSEYYCNKIYPKLNQLERNLRKLLFNTYTLQFGLDYYSTTVPASLQEKGKQIIKAKGNKQEKEIKRLKNFFYSLDYNDIQNLLFTPQWTDIDCKAKQDFLEKNTNLNELTDEELRKAFDEFTPKSDWSRLFNGKTNSCEEKIAQSLDVVREQRNNVAHCKFFKKNDYEMCNKVILKLNHEIISAIELTETKDFSEKNLQSVMASVKRIKESFLEFGKWLVQVSEIATKAIPFALLKMSETIKQISKTTIASTNLVFGNNDEDEKILDDDNHNEIRDDTDETN